MLRQGMTFMAAVTCVMLGVLFAMRLQKRARRLQAWRTALARLSGALSFAAFSLASALSYAAQPDAPLLQALREKMEAEPSASITKLWATLPKDDALTSEDERALLISIRALESPTVEEQCAGLDLSAQALCALEEKARLTCDKSARLYLSGGCLSGALLLLILL